MEDYHISKQLLNTMLTHIEKGIIILKKDNIIQYINSKASNLLGLPKKDVINRNLETICPELFVNGKIVNHPVDLINEKKVKAKLINESDSKDEMILFIEAYCKENKCDILENIINSMDEAIVACDNKGKIMVYNDANQKLDNLYRKNVLGRSIVNVYNIKKEDSLLFKVMKQKKPILDKHQDYSTLTGKKLNIMCSTYPLFKDNEVIGCFSVLKDYSKIKELSEKIVDLQQKLYKTSSKTTNKHTPVKSTKYTFKDIVGASQQLKKTVRWAKRAAETDSPILIYGETGTGKELFAQSIHAASKRSNNPFIAINCAAIPENLLEGILFGTVKGSFSGAIDRPGLFEQANSGTLLLDELNSMSQNLQSKLLRVIQEGAVRRVGGIKEIPVDVRIITNINLEPALAIKQQKLREDLYYRLSVVYLKVPPLRHRKEDIPILAKTFISKYNKKLSKNVTNLSSETMNIFMRYSWPGNIREFQHSIESAMNIIEDNEKIILQHHLPEHILNNLDNNFNKKDSLNISLDIEDLSTSMETVEKYILLHCLQENNWNISRTARQLNIRRQSLQYRIKKYDINYSN